MPQAKSKTKKTTRSAKATVKIKAKSTVRKPTVKTIKKTITKTTRSAKKDMVKKYRAHKNDTGSTMVQIALLSEQIQELTKHLKKHTKDFDSRRGLLIKIGKRRRLLNYLLLKDSQSYQKLIKDLKLRK